MIFRCRAPRRKHPDLECGQFVGVIADGAIVVGRIGKDDGRQSSRHYVMRCSCGALWEVAPPREEREAA